MYHYNSGENQPAQEDSPDKVDDLPSPRFDPDQPRDLNVRDHTPKDSNF